MTTPKEYAEDFARLWRMELPLDPNTRRRLRDDYRGYGRVADYIRLYGELLGIQEKPPEITLEQYLSFQMRAPFSTFPEGVTREERLRNSKPRIETEHSQRLVERLISNLGGSYVTEPCQEYLVDTFTLQHIGTGERAELLIPLTKLGISLEEERYGIFVPDNAQTIEGKLLDGHNELTRFRVHTFPEGSSPSWSRETTYKTRELNDRELNDRWNKAYNQRYQTAEPKQ